jgi:hypothetical protein
MGYFNVIQTDHDQFYCFSTENRRVVEQASCSKLWKLTDFSQLAVNLNFGSEVFYPVSRILFEVLEVNGQVNGIACKKVEVFAIEGSIPLEVFEVNGQVRKIAPKKIKLGTTTTSNRMRVTGGHFKL